MAFHFSHLESVKKKLELEKVESVDDREEIMSFILHSADISAQSKTWELAKIWG